MARKYSLKKANGTQPLKETVKGRPQEKVSTGRKTKVRSRLLGVKTTRGQTK